MIRVQARGWHRGDVRMRLLQAAESRARRFGKGIGRPLARSFGFMGAGRDTGSRRGASYRCADDWHMLRRERRL